jgi:hypothetical protein
MTQRFHPEPLIRSADRIGLEDLLTPDGVTQS